MSKQKDIQTITSLKKDVRGSYAALYKDYFGMIKYLVTKNSGTAEDASDVFQDAIIALFELVNKKTFTLNSTLKTLIYSISRNIWYKELRGKKVEVGFQDFEKHVEWSEEEVITAEDDSNIEKMEECIQAMGDPCKSILIQFYYLKKKMQEIADSLNYKTADHAKTQKYKCLQRLRQMVVK